MDELRIGLIIVALVIIALLLVYGMRQSRVSRERIRYLRDLNAGERVEPKVINDVAAGTSNTVGTREVAGSTDVTGSTGRSHRQTPGHADGNSEFNSGEFNNVSTADSESPYQNDDVYDPLFSKPVRRRDKSQAGVTSNSADKAYEQPHAPEEHKAFGESNLDADLPNAVVSDAAVTSTIQQAELKEQMSIDDALDEAASTEIPPTGVEGHTETAGLAVKQPRDISGFTKEPMLVTLQVVAAAGETFNGENISRAFENVGLTFGDKKIFHRLVNVHADAQSNADAVDVTVESISGEILNHQTLFSVANQFEPGYFTPEQWSDFRTSGLVFFTLLPNAYISGVDVFDDMLDTAKRVAEQLDGILLDNSNSTVSIQSSRFTRDEIADFERTIPG